MEAAAATPLTSLGKGKMLNTKSPTPDVSGWAWALLFWGQSLLNLLSAATVVTMQAEDAL